MLNRVFIYEKECEVRFWHLVEIAGLEPAASGPPDRRSSQLNYISILWWIRLESNQLPAAECLLHSLMLLTHIGASLGYQLTGSFHRSISSTSRASPLTSHTALLWVLLLNSELTVPVFCGFHATSKTTNPWRPVEALADSVHGAYP